MALLRDLLDQLVRSALPSRRRPAQDERPAESTPPADDKRPPARGQNGPFATAAAEGVDVVHTSYQPNPDGEPDPGEIVWTWVPYQENDGRGKDRPVLLVAREKGGTLIAVQLSSRDHDGDQRWVPVGAGGWDGEHRQSWVDIDRLIRVHPESMRREATALDREHFDHVIAALRERRGWS